MMTSIEVSNKGRGRVELPSAREAAAHFMTPPVAPLVLDCEVTGRCPYACEFCHGPEHNLRDELSAGEWGKVFSLFAGLGVRRFVITGGEPLARGDLFDILSSIPQFDGLSSPSITLSTTGYGLLKTQSHILDLLGAREGSEIGVPVDAGNPELNAAMRPRVGSLSSDGGLQTSIGVMRKVQELAGISLKLRTVASAVNSSYITDIPHSLEREGIDLSRVDWKIYQVNMHVGERVQSVKERQLVVTRARFKMIGEEVMAHWADSFRSISLQSAIESAERYMFVDPLGHVSVVKRQGSRAVSVDLGSLADEPLHGLDAMRYSAYLPMANVRPCDQAFIDQGLRL